MPQQSLAGGVGGIGPYRLAATPLSPVGSSYLQGTPAWLAYNHADQSFYVAVPPSTVDVVPGNFSYDPTVSAKIAVGANPFGVACDNVTGNVYVSNSGSDNVSVLSINQTTPIASIPVGKSPLGVAFDSANRLIYVANNGSHNVSVINTTTLSVVATVPVGMNPLGIAADPISGRVYVANYGSNNLTVISGSTNRVLANLDLPAGPYGVAVDSQTGDAYVTDEQASNVSVISGSSLTVVKNISVVSPQWWISLDLQGIAYDPGDGLIWVGAGHLSMVVISPANNTVLHVLNFDPSGVAYNSDTGDVCVTNAANATFECARFLPGSGPTKYTVQFNESGLPSGTNWSAQLNGSWTHSTTSQIPFRLPNGTYNFSVPPVGPYVPSPSSGLAIVSGSTLSIPVSFTPTGIYPATFNETGLAAGTLWSLWLGGATAQSNTSTITLNVTNGTYAYYAYTDRYVSNDSIGNVTVNGSAVVVIITFVAAPYVVTFQESGLPDQTFFEVILNGLVRSGVSTVPFWEPNGTFPYSVPDLPGYYAGPASGNVTVQGANVTQMVTFYPGIRPVTYRLSFHETGLPPGTVWAISVNGTSQSSSQGSVSFEEPNGTYAYVVGEVTGFASRAGGTVTVAGAPVSVQVAFGRSIFSLTFHETGLPNGTGWGVLIGSQVESSLSPAVSFSERNGTYGYIVLAQPGYETNYSGVAVVNGSDTVVSIGFTPQRFPIVFVEFGLPSGSNWSVTATNSSNGFNETHASSSNSIVIFLPNGTYTISFTLPSGYNGGSYTTQVTVAGKGETGATLNVLGPNTGTAPSIGLGVDVVAAIAAVSAIGAVVATTLVLRRRPPSSG